MEVRVSRGEPGGGALPAEGAASTEAWTGLRWSAGDHRRPVWPASRQAIKRTFTVIPRWKATARGVTGSDLCF